VHDTHATKATPKHIAQCFPACNQTRTHNTPQGQKPHQGAVAGPGPTGWAVSARVATHTPYTTDVSHHGSYANTQTHHLVRRGTRRGVLTGLGPRSQEGVVEVVPGCHSSTPRVVVGSGNSWWTAAAAGAACVCWVDTLLLRLRVVEAGESPCTQGCTATHAVHAHTHASCTHAPTHTRGCPATPRHGACRRRNTPCPCRCSVHEHLQPTTLPDALRVHVPLCCSTWGHPVGCTHPHNNNPPALHHPPLPWEAAAGACISHNIAPVPP
jgi:hypothetical protein